MKSCWEILGVEPTDGLKAVRKAYSQLVKEYHPEDDPEMYQQVFEAYQEAQSYLKNNKILESQKVNEDHQTFINNDYSKFDYNQDSSIDIEDDEVYEEDFYKTDISSRERDLIYRQVDMLYHSEHYNDFQAWQALLEENKDDLVDVIDRVLVLGIDKFTDERVIGCFSNSSSKHPKKEIFDERYKQLQKEYSIKFRILDGFFVLSSCAVIIWGLILMINTGYKSLFVNNEQVLVNLGMMVTSFLIFMQTAKMLTRNYDSKLPFYYRNKFLVVLTLIWLLVNGYFLYLNYKYVSNSIEFIDIIIGLFVNLSMYIIMHQKRYLMILNRTKKPRRDLSLFGILYIFMVLFIIGVGIYYLIRVKTTKNLEYFVILIAGLAALYSNSRAVVVCMKDKIEYYSLKNANALIVVNGLGSICSFNLLFHYLWETMRLNETNYMLLGLIIISASIVFFLYMIIEKDRKKQYFEVFELTDHFLAFNRIYEFISEKCDQGKRMERLTKYEKDIYLIGLFKNYIEDDLEKLYLDKNMIIEDLISALSQLQLEEVVQILMEANYIFYNDNLYVKNVERMAYFDELLYKHIPTIYEQAYVYICKYKRYFIYDKMKM